MMEAICFAIPFAAFFAFCKSVWIKALGALQIETATEKPNCRVVLEWKLKNYLFARGKVLGMMSSVFGMRRSFKGMEKWIMDKQRYSLIL